MLMESNRKTEIAEKLIIRHAGSLDASFGAINAEFQRLNPGIDIDDIPGGSAGLIRLIMKGQPCDILASADYRLFESWLIPDFADWYLIFAPNEFMLRCTDECLYSDEINADNWYEILQREGVLFWRPDPDDDPGGYRTLMVLQLAEKYYQVPGFYDKIMSPEDSVVLTRENYQLIHSTYTFAYGSSTVPQGQWNIKLPDEINLGNKDYAETYVYAKAKINGKKPGEKLILRGEPMLFGVTIPKQSRNTAAALEWLKFLVSETGSEIAGKEGLTILNPAIASDLANIPQELL